MNNLLQIREKIKRANRLHEAQILATKSGEVTPYRRSVFEERIRQTQKEMRFKDYDSELLLKILNKTLLETKKGDDKELFVDENWKINSKNMSNIIPSDNSNLKRILLDIFPNKKIVIQDNNDGSQTIFLS